MHKPWRLIQEQDWCSQRSGVKETACINTSLPNRRDNMSACIQQKRQRFYSSASDPTICFSLIYDIYVGFESTEHAGSSREDTSVAQQRASLCFEWKLLSSDRTNKSKMIAKPIKWWKKKRFHVKRSCNFGYTFSFLHKDFCGNVLGKCV